MRYTSLLCLTALFAGSASAALAAPADSDLKASFNVATQTEVPGLVLKPGSYSIRVVDHLSDRFIVRIEDKTGHHSTFIGLPSKAIGKAGSGMVTYDSGPDGGAAAKGFSFPGGTSVEFVYPKAEAVSLAKLNATSVTAIDPASEGRAPKQDNELSKDDMEVVTLWTLSSTKVTPGEDAPAIKAERYKATTVAQAEPAAPLGRARRSASADAANSAQPAATKPVIAKLPHTASFMPLVYLLSILSLLGAAVIRFSRPSFHNS